VVVSRDQLSPLEGGEGSTLSQAGWLSVTRSKLIVNDRFKFFIVILFWFLSMGGYRETISLDPR